MNHPVIQAIGTAVPERRLKQSGLMDAVLAATPPQKRLISITRRIYYQSGIQTRYTVIPDFYHKEHAFIPENPEELDGPPTSYRNSLFSEESPKLSIRSVEDLFNQLPSLNRQEITHLVTVSCTGFSAPGFDLELIRNFGLSKNIERFHIGFMGCLGAFPALRLANSICRAEASAKVLIVCTELCSLHYHHRFDTQTIVSNSLFADGSAAALVASNPTHGLVLKSFVTELLSNTQNDMSWAIGDHGFDMTLSQKVPLAIEKNIKNLLEKAVIKAGISPGQVSLWAVHPGGRGILEHSAKALGLEEGLLDSSYSVLKNYGNMSSATILFVLKDLMKFKGHLFTASFGPGLSAEAAILEAN